MEVIGGKDFCLSLFEPTFAGHMLACRAVAIAAGMIGDSRGTAMVATIDVTTEILCSAVQDVMDDFPVLWPQRVLNLVIGDMFFNDPGDALSFCFGLDDWGHGNCPFLMQCAYR
jgi:hypothetical protein